MIMVNILNMGILVNKFTAATGRPKRHPMAPCDNYNLNLKAIFPTIPSRGA
jgi:hypothetical protein